MKRPNGRPSHTAPMAPPQEALSSLGAMAEAAARKARTLAEVESRHVRGASAVDFDGSEPLLGGPFSVDHAVVVGEYRTGSKKQKVFGF